MKRSLRLFILLLVLLVLLVFAFFRGNGRSVVPPPGGRV